MAFRNPVRLIPASSIVGQIQGSQLAADAIDGKVITGATVRTSAGYPRIELAPDGNLYFYPAAGMEPGRIVLDGDAGTFQIVGPNADGVEYGVTFQKAFGISSAAFDTDEVTVGGSLYADNYRNGRVSITPSAANTPTSTTITGLGMSGSGPVRAYATASTTVPGTSVTGVGCTSADRDGVTIWVTRANTQPTAIDYELIGT